MKSVPINVGVGEAFDRLSILQIKCERIDDDEKVKYCKAEREALCIVVIETIDLPHFADHLYYKAILEINKRLWDVEDEIRTTTTESRFIELAKAVPRLNDKRADLKRQIDERFGSDVREVKSYV